MKFILGVVLAGTLATGCTVYTPGVAVQAPAAVVVDPGPGPGFCPPGQAKKGRC
ncbi:hypothetical protein [Cupriavidus basilensis]|uniref:hypothetical protein n=1 Tax=Cupriavidus basilensis TaxID=68895 RepID=UPI0002E19B7A|nr:hypothetical protein [Cupriavidus basilensis]